jgi:prepilin-type N-terminal cleavage/methylation domain-containing protein
MLFITKDNLFLTIENKSNIIVAFILILTYKHMKLQRIKSGFTLIELLVVITIIGILATGGVSVFTTQLQGARDSTRVNDMKLMETAVHQYFNDISIYPPESGFTGSIAQYVSKDLADPRT